MAELALLAETAGSEVLDAIYQRRQTPDPATFIGRGKVDGLLEIVQASGADTVILDGDLAPSQLRNLEDKLKVKAIDRTGLILDIFAQHAKSKEGQAQVELAQLQLHEAAPARLGWQPVPAGRWPGLRRWGIGGRGPGETKIETDRRRINTRIAKLRKELKELKGTRATMRQERSRNHIPSVSIAGYTNAGKSSLLNRLTDAGVLVENSLFATLDPTTRRTTTRDGRVYTMSDTVGFVRHLPHQLVEAFRSTLEEVAESDLILHVVDGSHPDPEGQLAAVREVFAEIHADKVPELVVINKADTADPLVIARLRPASRTASWSRPDRRGHRGGAHRDRVRPAAPDRRVLGAAALRARRPDQPAAPAGRDRRRSSTPATARSSAAAPTPTSPASRTWRPSDPRAPRSRSIDALHQSWERMSRMSRGAVLRFLLVLGLLAGCAAIALGVKPNLGLDLRGGAQFVFEANDTETTEATAANVDKTVEVLRGRVDALGVAESTLVRQGDNRILVELPGRHQRRRGAGGRGADRPDRPAERAPGRGGGQRPGRRAQQGGQRGPARPRTASSSRSAPPPSRATRSPAPRRSSARTASARRSRSTSAAPARTPSASSPATPRARPATSAGSRSSSTARSISSPEVQVPCGGNITGSTDITGDFTLTDRQRPRGTHRGRRAAPRARADLRPPRRPDARRGGHRRLDRGRHHRPDPHRRLHHRGLPPRRRDGDDRARVVRPHRRTPCCSPSARR